MSQTGLVVLNPSGTIALAERTLMIHAVEFMLIVIVPVFVLIFFFAWQYRASNKKAKYMPDWEHAKIDELIWWAIPFEIVLILGALTWGSTHTLDPRVPLDANPPLVVQVVALDWKWLFIYPEQHIATVNYVRIPVNRAVRFDITADAPMNSFWIPQLGGQIYAMTGMVNSLNLMATETGTFAGSSANYSGEGFAQMKFAAQATSQADFDSWVATVHAAPRTLDKKTFEQLALPSEGNAVGYYSSIDDTLYNTIVMKFMSPEVTGSHTH